MVAVGQDKGVFRNNPGPASINGTAAPSALHGQPLLHAELTTNHRSHADTVAAADQWMDTAAPQEAGGRSFRRAKDIAPNESGSRQHYPAVIPVLGHDPADGARQFAGLLRSDDVPPRAPVAESSKNASPGSRSKSMPSQDFPFLPMSENNCEDRATAAILAAGGADGVLALTLRYWRSGTPEGSPAAPVFITCLPGVGRFCLTVQYGRHSLRDGNWHIDTRAGPAAHAVAAGPGPARGL